MLFKIGKRAEKLETDAVDNLLDCHRRIRHFTTVAGALASATGVPPAEIATGAASVAHYFTKAIPLHSRDEDESLSPRLLALDLDRAARDALLAMTHQHGALHATIAELAPLWRILTAEPTALDRLRADLVRLTQRLEALWNEHLTAEESIVFPSARRLLSPDVLQQIAREMRARRSPAA